MRLRQRCLRIALNTHRLVELDSGLLVVRCGHDTLGGLDATVRQVDLRLNSRKVLSCRGADAERQREQDRTDEACRSHGETPSPGRFGNIVKPGTMAKSRG